MYIYIDIYTHLHINYHIQLKNLRDKNISLAMAPNALPELHMLRLIPSLLRAAHPAILLLVLSKNPVGLLIPKTQDLARCACLVPGAEA